MTRYDPAMHHRRSIRLHEYDYRQANAYFVTLCTHGRMPFFGAIVDDAMQLNAYGALVVDDWLWLAARYPFVDLDACVVMPNHLHGIVVVTDVASAPTKSLGRLIGAFKTVSTRHVNEWRETPGAPLWQRDFYEHVIRNGDDLDRIRAYIAANPARWSEDHEYVSPINTQGWTSP